MSDNACKPRQDFGRGWSNSMASRIASLVALLLVVGCAAPARPSAPQTGETPPTRPQRTLVVAIRLEPSSIASRPILQAGVGLYLPSRMFNAQLAFLDDSATVRPYLLESLPVLNSENWRVFPDGRMEVTYRLKPNLEWHDGAPLTAEDFAFSYKLYTSPTLGQGRQAPFRYIDEVVASDPRTFVVHFSQAYPDTAFVAGLNADFPPLPKHLLERLLNPDQMDALPNSLFWTREYVGAGPYKLDRWEPGTFLEAIPTGKHVLGNAKIGRIKLQFMPDARAALASVLAGEVHLTDGTSVGLPEAAVLKREWIVKGLGAILYHPNQWRAAHFQHRPDYVSPPTLLNPAIRQAIAHSVDRQPLNDALYDGDGILSSSPFAPQSVWGAVVDRAAVAYPYDPRRAEQIMAAAGYVKGADGIFAHPNDGRLTYEVKTNAASDNESEIAILASSWRRAGFDAREAILPAALAQNPEARATFSGMYTNSQNCCESAMLGLVSTSVASADNRWSGGNRSGYSNPEFDRLIDSFTRTLERAERERQMAQLVRILTEDVQSVTLFIRAQAWSYVSELKGITLAPPEGNMSWNIQNWEFQ